MDRKALDLELEALLLAAGRPMTGDEISAFFPTDFSVAEAIQRLADFWSGRGAAIEKSADGWSFSVDRNLLPSTRAPRTRNLTQGALGTLAAIAIHQPVTRSRIAEIRRTKVSLALLDDLEHGSGLIVGRRRQTGSGQATEYSVTERFLEEVGLETLLDFPTADEAISLRFQSAPDAHRY